MFMMAMYVRNRTNDIAQPRFFRVSSCTERAWTIDVTWYLLNAFYYGHLFTVEQIALSSLGLTNRKRTRNNKLE